ncbi:Uncharacterised protein [uncultured archaeon]|nr:Uncharacterised protein [uncultured archaeon]
MITSIKREFNLFPNIVGIVTTDDLTAITTTGYFSTQSAEVELLNNGTWQWEVEDIVLIFYATDLIGWFTYDASTDAFVSLAANGGISNTLPSGDIIVGNSSNIATARAMSGDATISNTGVLTIANLAVTGAKMANNTVDYAQLALDVAASATVTLTASQVQNLYATPVQLIAAPGAGKLILIDSILWDIAFVSAQYAAGGAIAAQYGSTIHGAGPAASGTLAAASLNGVAASGFLSNAGSAGLLNVASSASLNTAVYLSNASAAFTTGDSTVTLYVKYRVVTPA